MSCFSLILFLAGFVMIMVTFIRWFEQTTEAVDNGWWNKIFVLLMCPFTVWFFPSASRVGRAFPVQTQSSLVSGASVEDRLTQFITSQVRDVERELDAAMQQGAGGAGGDSRTLVSQKVQQLAQKRSELIETLTNTLKSLHDSSMSVARNVKS